MTSYRRRCDASTLIRRHFDVVCLLGALSVESFLYVVAAEVLSLRFPRPEWSSHPGEPSLFQLVCVSLHLFNNAPTIGEALKPGPRRRNILKGTDFQMAWYRHSVSAYSRHRSTLHLTLSFSSSESAEIRFYQVYPYSILKRVLLFR